VSAVAVARVDELSASEATRVEVDGIAIAIVLGGDGTIHAIGDRCSHGEVSLSDGFVEDDTIECWAHGAKFSLRTGAPLSLPAYEPVPVFKVVVDDGVVLIDPTVTIDQRADEAQNAQEA